MDVSKLQMHSRPMAIHDWYGKPSIKHDIKYEV